MARIIALSAFRQLGYTQTQAEQLEAAAVLLAAATGIYLDRAETEVRDLVEGLGVEAYRPSSRSVALSGQDW